MGLVLRIQGMAGNQFATGIEPSPTPCLSRDNDRAKFADSRDSVWKLQFATPFVNDRNFQKESASAISDLCLFSHGSTNGRPENGTALAPGRL